MIKKNVNFITVVLSAITLFSYFCLHCIEQDFSGEEDTGELVDAANALLGLRGPSVQAIAEKNNLTQQTVAQAVLAINEEPGTPLPSADVDYTPAHIISAASKWKLYADEKRKELAVLNKQEIMQKEGVTQEEIENAFKAYKYAPNGELPTTKPLIQLWAKRYNRNSKSKNNYSKANTNKLTNYRREYRESNKKRFAKNDTPEMRQELAAQTGLPISTVEEAFTFYRSQATGEMPLKKDRIQELANRKRKNNYSKANTNKLTDYRREYRKRRKERFTEIDTPEMRQELATKTGLPISTVEEAFTFYRNEATGEMPLEKDRIEELAEQYTKWRARQKAYTNKLTAAKASTSVQSSKARVKRLTAEQLSGTLGTEQEQKG